MSPKAAIWLLVVAGLYGGLVWVAHQSLYYPMRHPRGDWGLQSELGASDVWLRAADGVRLHAWFIPQAAAQVVTLHLHGNGGNITHRASAAARIARAGSALLLLDYRGYGRSEGTPREQGLYRDADAAYDWLVTNGWRPGQIVIHGESLGSAVAVDIAARRAPAGLILEAPFSSARAVAGRVLPWLGPGLIWGFDPKSKIHAVRAPILVIHGDRDEVIDYRLGRELYDAAPEPKEFWTIPGASHNDIPLIAGEEYGRRLAAFYARLK